MSTLSAQPLVISLTETKIKGHPFVNINLPGYNFLQVKSFSNAGDAGVYISESLQFEKLTFVTTISGSESVWIKKITCPSTYVNHVIGTVYRHPNTNVNEFNDYVIKILTNLNMTHKHYFILGDITINIDKKKTLFNNAKNYLNMLSSNGSKNIIDISIGITSSTPTILDHIVTYKSKHKIFLL